MDSLSFTCIVWFSFLTKYILAQQSNIHQAFESIERKDLSKAIDYLELESIKLLLNSSYIVPQKERNMIVQLIQDLELTRNVLVGKVEIDYMLALCYFIYGNTSKSISYLSQSQWNNKNEVITLIYIKHNYNVSNLNILETLYKSLTKSNLKYLSDKDIVNLAYSLNKPHWALEYLDSKIAEKPQFNLLLLRARHHIRFMSSGRAMYDILAAKSLDPNNDEVKTLEAAVLITNGKLDKAKELINQVLSNSPDNQEALSLKEKLERLQKN